MKLRSLKKDVQFLAYDLSSIISVRVYIEGVEVEKVKASAVKVSEFRNAYLTKIVNPALDAQKPLKSQLAKARRESGEERRAEAIKAYLAAKRAYGKGLKKAYKQISDSMLSEYAGLAEEISKA